jgi:hypothetical protein
MAKAVGVKSEVSSVEITPATDTAPESLAVELGADGSFPLVYKFMKLVENSPYEVEFSSTYLERSTSVDAKNPTTPMWTLKLSLKVLSFIK